ncbi:hypothetical protein IWQ57_006477 [Coemansia nantahalensis]|uniref:Uncharacterized protein n=2 Tax=Coemansia TaxID=4863 RepID=A0ACC1L0D8_9FUNG|nr:hypothetical protein IWQ57_006477 [Coemansia nantahalensis]KAJ2798897.1 hypothetical protein H4R21_003745 [Coemansia helicoidea]
MSNDAAACILFGDLRESYIKQQTRVETLRAATAALEMRFLASVRDRTTRPDSSVSDAERHAHDQLRGSLGCARQRLADEVRLLQWLRRRHNSAILSRRAAARYLVF